VIREKINPAVSITNPLWVAKISKSFQIHNAANSVIMGTNYDKANPAFFVIYNVSYTNFRTMYNPLIWIPHKHINLISKFKNHFRLGYYSNY